MKKYSLGLWAIPKGFIPLKVINASCILFMHAFCFQVCLYLLSVFLF